MGGQWQGPQMNIVFEKAQKVLEARQMKSRAGACTEGSANRLVPSAQQLSGRDAVIEFPREPLMLGMAQYVVVCTNC